MAKYTAKELRLLAQNARFVGHNRDHLADALEWCVDQIEPHEERVYKHKWKACNGNRMLYKCKHCGRYLTIFEYVEYLEARLKSRA